MMRINSISDYILNRTSVGLFESCVLMGFKPFFERRVESWELEYLPNFLTFNQRKYDILLKNYILKNNKLEGEVKKIKIPELDIMMTYKIAITKYDTRERWSEGICESIEIDFTKPYNKKFYVREDILYFTNSMDDTIDICVDGIETVKKSVDILVKQGVNEEMKDILKGSLMVGDNLPYIKPVCVIDLERKMRIISKKRPF